MVNFYEYIDERHIKPAPYPLRIEGQDVFTDDEAIYNDHGYYALEKTPYPTDGKLYKSKYELFENKIIQSWIEAEPPAPGNNGNEGD